jgi:uncharacterized Zn finger protein
MTKAISRTSYRKLQKLIKEQAKILDDARRDGLAKIAASGRNLIVREDAVGSYCEARFWMQIYVARLAAAHPELAPDWSPNARRRHFGSSL